MKKPKYDYSKLQGKIKEKFKTNKAFAKAMGLSKTSISYKLNCLTYWKQEEIEKAILLLGIDSKDIHDYFFTPEVENISTGGEVNV